MSRRFRPPAAIEADPEGSAVSELSADALHMTSSLRTGRRVGRTIYAQLGPEPSDVDPLVATADSPVLAERIVRAVNAAAPEPNSTDPGDGYGVDNTTRVTAVDTQSAAPTRDELIAAFKRAEVVFNDRDGRWLETDVREAERMADVALGVLRDAELRGPSLDEPATARLGDVPTTLRWVSAVIKADLSMAEGEQEADEHRALLRRIAGAQVAVYDALGVLRGGGADGGGEDETEHVDLIDSDADRWKQVEPGVDAWYCTSPGHVGDCTETRAYIEDKHGPVHAVPPQWPEGEETFSWLELADEFKGTSQQSREHSEKQERETGRANLFALGRSEGRMEAEARIRRFATLLGSSADTQAIVARLASAAGVSPDSEDVVGEVEAAIRAGHAGHEDLFAAEADYWQKRHGAVAGRVRAAVKALSGGGEHYLMEPGLESRPEPPVGTTFTNPETGEIAWQRQPDGWHCTRADCWNCPAGWDEVCDWGRGVDGLVRHLPVVRVGTSGGETGEQ